MVVVNLTLNITTSILNESFAFEFSIIKYLVVNCSEVDKLKNKYLTIIDIKISNKTQNFFTVRGWKVVENNFTICAKWFDCQVNLLISII